MLSCLHESFIFPMECILKSIHDIMTRPTSPTYAVHFILLLPDGWITLLKSAYKISRKQKDSLGFLMKNKKWFLLKVNEIFKTDLLLVIGNWVVLMCGLFGISCWPLSRWDLKLTCVVVFIRAISESWKETKGNSKENNISFWETAYVQRLFQS